MLTWFLMTCSVFVKTEMQAFVLPKLYTCNRGISMQRDASQEDLMWKMTSKKTKRPPVKPFHSPIQVGYSNQRERCKPMRVTVNLWFLLLSYVHDILQSQKLHRSLVERQVDGTDCIWRAHTIEPCFGCCAKQLNATRPENPWTTFANDKAVSWCLRLLLNQVGWEKSMSNVSYSLPERVAVSKHLNCDLDLGAFSGNVSRCWNELEKKSWKEIWQHLWKLNSELQVLRFRAEEFVYEDLASAHCWRTFVHFQLGEPDWGPDDPDHVHWCSLLCQTTSLCFFGKWDASTYTQYTPQEYARAETPLYDLLCFSRQNGVPLMKMTLWAFFRSLMHCWKRYPLLSCIRFRLQIPHKALILSQLDVNYEPCKSFWKASEVRQERYL